MKQFDVAIIGGGIAGPVMRNMVLTLKKNSVLYVQGGWQTLVDQLYEKANQAGVDTCALGLISYQKNCI